MLPMWAQRFILLVVGIGQIIPLMIGTYLVAAAFGAVGQGAFSAQRFTAGVCFLGVAGATFIALYRDVRFGEPYNRSRAFVVSVVLLIAGVILNRP
jgi:formate-dependent nitrite reductase membrane component NrfD